MAPLGTLDFPSLVAWAFPASLVGLAVVLWWLGRYGFERLDRVDERFDALTVLITGLRDDMHKDVAAIRERLARIEGHIWPGKGVSND